LHFTVAFASAYSCFPLFGAPAFVGTVARGDSGIFATGVFVSTTPPWRLHAPRPAFEVVPSAQ
jgi:hypothetical protein